LNVSDSFGFTNFSAERRIHMDKMLAARLFSAALLLGMLICLEIGRNLGMKRLAKDPDGALSGLGIVESAVFGLYGLLLAFTFSGAGARFDARRQLIAEEVNMIGTANLRLDLLPAESQPALREQLRRYVDSRIEVYRRLPDPKAVEEELSKSAKLQMAIWAQAVAATRLPGSHNDAAKLLLPALNQMIDITTTRTLAARSHPPPIVFALLFLLGLVSSVLAGYSMARGKLRNWVHITAFTTITVISVYVILDIEYPRVGFVRLDAYDQLLVQLRESMQ
jgi:hypothetical protein